MKTLNTLIATAALTLLFTANAHAGDYVKTGHRGGSHFSIQFGTPGVFLHYGARGPYGYYQPYRPYYRGYNRHFNRGVYKPWKRHRRGYQQLHGHYHADSFGRQVYCTVVHEPGYVYRPNGPRYRGGSVHLHPHH